MDDPAAPAPPREGLRRAGFTRLPGLFHPQDIAAALAEVRGVFRRQMIAAGLDDPAPGPAPTDERALHDALVAFARAHPQRFTAALGLVPQLLSLGALATGPAMGAALASLGISAPVCPTPPICYFLTEALAIPGDHHRAPAHQDWRYLQSSLDALTVWVPLVEVDRATGVVELLPESHRRGLWPTEGARMDLRIRQDLLPDSGWVAPHLLPGDALAFSALTVHRSGVNASGRMRWAVAFRYANLDEPTFIRRGYPNPYRYQPTLELLEPGFPTPEEVAASLAAPPGPDADAAPPTPPALPDPP